MATHSSILTWRIPWTEEPGRLQSRESQRVDTTEQLHFHILWTANVFYLLELSRILLLFQIFFNPELIEFMHTEPMNTDNQTYVKQLINVSSTVQFSRSVMSSSLQSHGPQHVRFPYSSPTPRACSNSCPSSQWCHPTIASSVIPSSPCFNLSQHHGLFQWVSSLY